MWILVRGAGAVANLLGRWACFVLRLTNFIIAFPLRFDNVADSQILLLSRLTCQPGEKPCAQKSDNYGGQRTRDGEPERDCLTHGGQIRLLRFTLVMVCCRVHIRLFRLSIDLLLGSKGFEGGHCKKF